MAAPSIARGKPWQVRVRLVGVDNHAPSFQMKLEMTSRAEWTDDGYKAGGCCRPQGVGVGVGGYHAPSL